VEIVVAPALVCAAVVDVHERLGHLDPRALEAARALHDLETQRVVPCGFETIGELFELLFDARHVSGPRL
jgi:hypothetical protein